MKKHSNDVRSDHHQLVDHNQHIHNNDRFFCKHEPRGNPATQGSQNENISNHNRSDRVARNQANLMRDITQRGQRATRPDSTRKGNSTSSHRGLPVDILLGAAWKAVWRDVLWIFVALRRPCPSKRMPRKMRVTSNKRHRRACVGSLQLGHKK